MDGLNMDKVHDREIRTNRGEMIQMQYLDQDKVKKKPCVKMTYFRKEIVGGEPAWKEFHRAFVFSEESTSLIVMLLLSGMTDMDKVAQALNDEG